MKNQNKTFEFNLKKTNIYNALGETLFLVNNLNKYLTENKPKTKNAYNQLIIVAILTGICFSLISIKYLIIYSCFIMIILFLLIIKTLKIMQPGKITFSTKKIIINKNNNDNYNINYKQIILVELTKNALIIITKKPKKTFILEPNKEIFDEINKYI